MKWQLYFPLILSIMAFVNISFANGYWKLLWLIMGLYWCGSFIFVLERVIDEKVEEEMTEKRYVEELWAYDDIMVKDNETGEELWNNMIYERMNEQNEQIKELEIELRNKTVKWEHELGMKLKYHSKLIDSEKENEQLKSTNMEMEDYLARLEESNINLQIKLQKIRDYAKEDGEIKQGVIEKVILND